MTETHRTAKDNSAAARLPEARLTAAQRKQKIVDVTVDLVTKYGVEGTTTARIAEAAGVSERTLYRYFDTRAEMLLGALDVVLDIAVSIFQPEPGTNAVDRIRAAGVRQWRRHAAPDREFVYPLFEFMAAPPEVGLRDHLRARHKAHVNLVAAIIEEGKTKGVIRREVASEQVAWEVFAILFGADVSYLVGTDARDLSECAQTMLDRLLRDIVA
jgi:AcrR family transcriptional regulator